MRRTKFEYIEMSSVGALRRIYSFKEENTLVY